MPKAKRSRARLPGAPTRLPKVPLSLRALGGVDPRTLPPGTPYPCNDPAVGASVRGKHFAGKILGCATPPPGKHGRHFVVGGLESRSAIASAKRASERDREALRARYEGPDFDARPKRRGPKPVAPVSRPSTVKRREELPLPLPVGGVRSGFDRQKVLNHIEQYDDNIALKRERGEVIPQEWIDKRAALAATLRGETAETGIASLPVFGHPQATTVRPEKYGYLVPIRVRDAATLERRLGDVQTLFAELASKISRAMDDAKSRDPKKSKAAKAYLSSAQRGEDEVVRDLLHNETRGELARLLKIIKSQEPAAGPRPSTVKRREELPLPRPVSMRRRPEMAGPEWSPRKRSGVDEEALRQAILAQMEAHNLPRSTRAADMILGALLRRAYPSAGALDPSNKTYRDIFAIFSGVKLPSTIKGSKALIERGEFTLLPPSQWSRGATPADIAKRDAAVFNEARGILAKAFLRVFHGQFAKGESPIPGQRVSVAEVAVTPSFRPKGEASDAKVYVVRLHEGSGVFAFMLRAQAPDIPEGLISGPPLTLLSGSLWQKMLKGAIEK